MNVFWTSTFFALPPAGRFSCSRLRGTREARVNTECKCGPWPRSVARGLRVERRETGKQPTASLSDQLEPTRPMQTRKQTSISASRNFLVFHLWLLRRRCNSRPSSFSLCDSYELCFRAWVCEHACVCARVNSVILLSANLYTCTLLTMVGSGRYIAVHALYIVIVVNNRIIYTAGCCRFSSTTTATAVTTSRLPRYNSRASSFSFCDSHE